jgi:phosphoglycolate phosphatase-like HAD superfamily hydrolase
VKQSVSQHVPEVDSDVAVGVTGERRVVLARPGLQWDAFDAYLFDIDGTLLRAQGGVHNDAFPESVRQVTGHEVSLEKVMLHGNTDSRILAQAFEDAGIARSAWEPYQQAIHDRMWTLVDQRREQIQIIMMPGIRESLEHLRKLGRVLGAATGNLELIGWLKIELAGLRDYFTFGSFSDQHEERAAMIAAGATLARLQGGPHASVCVVGDTPADIAAARANNLPVIAVATGHYSVDDLLAYAPDIVATNMQVLLDASVAHSRSSSS